MKTWTKVALFSVAALLIGVGIGNAASTGQPQGEAQSNPTVTVSLPGPTITIPGEATRETVPGPTVTVTKTSAPKPTAKAPASASITGDGVYLVGKDIKPGTYRSTGGNGYWARLRGTGGELDDIIANGIGSNQVVTIHSSDYAFETSGFDGWVRVR